MLLPIRRLLAVAFVLIPLGAGACTTQVADEADADGETADLTNSSLTLHYEGTCDFLRSCSRWSRGFPEGYVLWGCSAENIVRATKSESERGPCSDDDFWIAGPYRSSCGQWAHICRGKVCVDAKVKDISVSHSWEASNAVLDGLGMNHVLIGQCSGSGGGTVRITTLHSPPAHPSRGLLELAAADAGSGADGGGLAASGTAAAGDGE